MLSSYHGQRGDKIGKYWVERQKKIRKIKKGIYWHIMYIYNIYIYKYLLRKEGKRKNNI